MGVRARVLEEHTPARGVDGVVAGDVEVAVGVVAQSVPDGLEELRLGVLVAGGQDQPLGVQLEVLALLLLAEGEGVGAVGVTRFVERGVGQQSGGHRAAEVLLVEQVEDLVDEIAVDALEQALLLGREAVAGPLGQLAEVVDVLRGGHLQGELGVFEREEARGAGDPVQPVAVHVDLAEQVVVDLGGRLPGADQRDRLLLLEFRLVPQVLGVVQEVAAQAGAGLRDVRGRAGAEDQVAGAEALTGGGPHDVHVVLVRHLRDRRREAHAAQFVRGPAAVVVVLDPQRVEVLPDVERVQPALLLQVVEEGVRRGRVGQRDQVRHERGLEVGAVEEHAGVPLEVRLGLQEDAVERVDRLGEAGEAEVEGAEPDPHEVIGVAGFRKRGQGTLPGTARRGRRSGRGRRRCRRSSSRGSAG